MSLTTCPTCKQPVDSVQLERQRAADKGVEPTTVRIVRPGQIFMKAKGGQPVEVPNQYLNHRSTLLATMSVEEWKLEVEKARTPKHQEGPSSVDLARSLKDRVDTEAKRKRAQAQAPAAE